MTSQIKENKKAIQPIEFMNSKEKVVESPISFIEKPISFMAKKINEFGMLENFEVQNPKLVSTAIPDNVDEKEFEKAYENLLRNLSSNVSDDEKKHEDKIIRPEEIQKKTKLTELTNYELFPKYQKIYFDKDGNIDYQKNEFGVEIIIHDGIKIAQREFIIKCVEIDKITSLVGKKFPNAIIYNKRDAVEVENDFRKKTSQVPKIRCFTDAGGQVIDGKHTYLHSSYELSNSEMKMILNLPNSCKYSNKDIWNIWNKSLEIYNGYEVVSTLLMYSYLGVTYKLFEEAGYTPHFLLFLTGKTGSLKTTIAKILYTQLADDRYREYPRRIDADTVVSFERALVLAGRDTVTLVDDYSPAKNKHSEIDMQNKLESIIRMVGDGSTKSRSNTALEDCRGEGVKGAVTLTGELRGKGLSSNLRCLYCEIEKENVNLEIVTWFQKNRDAYTTMLSKFTVFLGDNWMNVVMYIKTQFEEKRRKAESQIRQRRLIDALVSLWMMADIIGEFLKNIVPEYSSTIDSQIKMICSDLVGAVSRSELATNTENPALVFMKALVSMLDNKKLHISNERLEEYELSAMDGFEDAEYFYFVPDNVYRKVSQWLKMGSIYWGMDINQLGSTLCKEGFALSTTNGMGKKVYYARKDIGTGKKVKFIKIPKNVINKLQEIE